MAYKSTRRKSQPTLKKKVGKSRRRSSLRPKRVSLLTKKEKRNAAATCSIPKITGSGNVAEVKDDFKEAYEQIVNDEGMSKDAGSRYTLILPTQVLPDTIMAEIPYTMPDLHMSLTIHGLNTTEVFRVPTGFEVVIFSRRGQLLALNTISSIRNWLARNAETLRKSDFSKYHLKKLILKDCKYSNSAFKEFRQRTAEWISYPGYNETRSIYTSTIQIFREDSKCPNIELSNDERTLTAIDWGFINVQPYTKNMELTKDFYDHHPYPKPISLEDTLKYIRSKIPDKKIRLYLFCCRAGDAVPEGINSPKSIGDLSIYYEGRLGSKEKSSNNSI